MSQINCNARFNILNITKGDEKMRRRNELMMLHQQINWRMKISRKSLTEHLRMPIFFYPNSVSALLWERWKCTPLMQSVHLHGPISRGRSKKFLATTIQVTLLLMMMMMKWISLQHLTNPLSGYSAKKVLPKMKLRENLIFQLMGSVNSPGWELSMK